MSEEEFKPLKEALKAKIVSNLPVEPRYIREETKKVIDEFNFRDYIRREDIELVEEADS